MQKILHSFQFRVFLISVGFFGLFVCFSFLVNKNLFNQIDFDTTVKLQDNLPRRVDDLFSWFSEIGSFEIVTAIIILFLIFLRQLSGIFVLFSFGLFHIFEVFGKVFVDHLPPPEFMIRSKSLIEFPQFHVRLENSYPSGHAGRALFLTTIIAFITWKQKRFTSTQKIFIYAVLAIYDITMLISRIYLGEHWVSDVIGGSLLGTSFALFGSVFLQIPYKKIFFKNKS